MSSSPARTSAPGCGTCWRARGRGVRPSGYLAAVYLAGDATRSGEHELARAFRLRALVMGLVSGALAIAGLVVLRADARALFDDLTSGAGIVAVLVSGAAGV